MKRDLAYYLNLPYKIEIKPIPEEDGGGYIASMPELGRYAIAGDGETIEEAIKSLNEIKEIMFSEWIAQGITIPEPITEQSIAEYSGKFVIRIPRYLHYNLSMQAKRNGVSLNQFIATLLAQNFECHSRNSILEEVLAEIKTIRKHVFEVKSKIDTKLTMKREHFSQMVQAEEHEYSKAA